MRHGGRSSIDHTAELRIRGCGVGDQRGLVDLVLARQERRQQGNAHAATEVAREIAEAGDLVALVGRILRSSTR